MSVQMSDTEREQLKYLADGTREMTADFIRKLDAAKIALGIPAWASVLGVLKLGPRLLWRRIRGDTSPRSLSFGKKYTLSQQLYACRADARAMFDKEYRRRVLELDNTRYVLEQCLAVMGQNDLRCLCVLRTLLDQASSRKGDMELIGAALADMGCITGNGKKMYAALHPENRALPLGVRAALEDLKDGFRIRFAEPIPGRMWSLALPLIADGTEE